MKTETQNLMKHFASVLRARALGKEKEPSISVSIARYLTRKDLIEIITSPSFTGSRSVKEIDLLKMENEELSLAIGDEMFIISFMTQKWSNELSERLDKKEPKPALEKVDTKVKKTPATTKK
tara:strand:+ start:388605 stop:388970 length:366 start_codon:yes stop_codon:yes gene_type:complete